MNDQEAINVNTFDMLSNEKRPFEARKKIFETSANMLLLYFPLQLLYQNTGGLEKLKNIGRLSDFLLQMEAYIKNLSDLENACYLLLKMCFNHHSNIHQEQTINEKVKDLVIKAIEREYEISKEGKDWFRENIS